MALSLLLICNGSLVIAYCAAQGRRGPVPLLSRRLLTTVGGANATSWDRWPPVAPGSKMLCVTFPNTSHSQIPFRREVRQQSCSKWWHSSVELRSQPAAHALAEGPQWASRRGFTLRHGSKPWSGLCQLGHWIRLGTARVCRKHRIQCCISRSWLMPLLGYRIEGSRPERDLYHMAKLGGMEMNSAVERSNRESQNYLKCCANGSLKPLKEKAEIVLL